MNSPAIYQASTLLINNDLLDYKDKLYLCVRDYFKKKPVFIGFFPWFLYRRLPGKGLLPGEFKV
jgi:hypothetical protein